MDLMDHMTMPGPSSPAASLVGRFLVAAPSMPDERFRRSVVFICKHDDDGALGIIVNNSVDDLPLGQVSKQLGIDVPPVSLNMAGVQLRQLGCVDDLLDVLGVMTSDQVRITLADANSSALLQEADNDDSAYVVMPMRL